MSGDDSELGGLGGLFQIAEPDEPTVARRAPGRGIGIDLGTTHSLVAVAPCGAPPRVLADAAGAVLLPSVVAYLEGEPVVGAKARARQVEAPERVVSSVKRFMGRGPGEIAFAHPYRLGEREGDAGQVLRFDVGGGRLVTPMEVSAQILRELKARAEAELGGPVDGAVITVPAYFDDTQRQATKDAGRLAGLNVYRLLAEPTAAALAYGLDRQEQGLFAIYDLGGGTFDVSILRLKDGVFQVLATAGDTALGGDDLDRVLADELLRAAQVTAPTPSQREAALAAARRAKESLSGVEEVGVDVPEIGLAAYTVSRARFEELARPIVRRTAAPCRQALKDAGVRPEELDGVVLVGGSTRVPLVRRTVARLFRREPLADIDPDVVVAHGAAIQADILSGSAREGVTLLDVAPLSLGVETMGGIVEKIIPRNATIPIRARQVFTNYSEQQTGMTIHVVQGERELVDDCRSLARFELRGIPRLPPSHARIEVTFELDADALLTVTARELMTGVSQTVQVKPTFGLSEDEVEAMIVDSLEHAQDDYAARDRAEARVELGRVWLAVQRALDDAGEDPALLPPDERARVEAALAAARRAMDDADTTGDGLVAARAALEAASEPFARRRMERALREGMGGKALGEVEAALGDEESLAARRVGHDAELLDPSGEPA